MSSQARSLQKFIIYSSLMFCTNIFYGAISEKMLKQPYSNQKTHEKDYFKYFIPLAMVPTFFTTVISYLMIDASSIKDIPNSLVFLTSLSDVGYIILGYLAVMLSSYIIVTMVHSCGFLFVIIIAVYFSGVKNNKLKLGPEKIISGIVICLGIFVFNYNMGEQTNPKNHPLTYFTLFILIIAMTLQGFRADFQAQIKQSADISLWAMVFKINFVSLLLYFIGSLITGQLYGFIIFLIQHDNFSLDILSLGILGIINELLIYSIIKDFKQHVVPLLAVIRRFLIIGFNIMWFHHPINAGKIVGLGILIVGVGIEALSNYYNMQKSDEIQEKPLKIVEYQDVQ